MYDYRRVRSRIHACVCTHVHTVGMVTAIHSKRFERAFIDAFCNN